MRLRGNFTLLYAVQAICGILVWFASQRWGIAGLGIGLIPYFVVMILVLRKHTADEREMQLSHKINSYESIGIGILAGIIYIFFPDIDWFFALIASASLLRGIVGSLVFALR